jgi:hypothetical protein
LLVAGTDSAELTCIGATVTDNALEMDVVGNTALGSMDVNWFTNLPAGDFRLSMTHPGLIDTAAVWMTGDPAEDIEGDDRGTMDGSPAVAGADVP